MEENQQRHEDKEPWAAGLVNSLTSLWRKMAAAQRPRAKSSNCEYASWFSSYLWKAVYVCVHV